MTEVQDDLLAQLNGKPAADGMPAFVKGEGLTPAPSRDSELEVHAAPKLSAVAAADAQHSTAAGGSGYRVRVHGEYFALNADGKGKIKKAYANLTFNVTRAEGCLSVIKNKMLKAALRKLDPNFTADRTCFIDSVTPLSAATPKSRNLAYMDRAGLDAYVLESSPRIPIDVAAYPVDDEGTAALRESIIDYVQNPDPVRPDEKGVNTVSPGDPGTFLFRERERRAHLAEDRELALLNPGLNVKS